jgi:hypothetical protein
MPIIRKELIEGSGLSAVIGIFGWRENAIMVRPDSGCPPHRIQTP